MGQQFLFFFFIQPSSDNNKNNDKNNNKTHTVCVAVFSSVPPQSLGSILIFLVFARLLFLAIGFPLPQFYYSALFSS